jgi:iron(III) transport system substrate-binding protein
MIDFRFGAGCRLVRGLCTLALTCVLVSCDRTSPPSVSEVVIYTSLDRPHSQPVLDRFEKETGIRVKALYDTEASKTVGLVNRLIGEASHPQADVFWSSEVIRTLVLKDKGVLTTYRSPAADQIPPEFRDPEGYWTGFAARARVFLVNTELTQEAPASLQDLTKPKWRGKFAMANPLFGTTGTEVANTWVNWGPERTRRYLAALRENGAVITSGNATACEMVANGRISVCMTDTDDAFTAIEQGHPVRMIFPDQGEDEGGALLIPNTVSLIKNSPHSENGKKLIDFLLSAEVEEMLAQSVAGQIPVRPEVPQPEKVRAFGKIRFMKVDFEQAAKAIPESSEAVRGLLLDPKP